MTRPLLLGVAALALITSPLAVQSAAEAQTNTRSQAMTVDPQRGVLYVGSLANRFGAGGKDKDGDVEVTRVDLATGAATIDVLHDALLSYGGGDDGRVAVSGTAALAVGDPYTAINRANENTAHIPFIGHLLPVTGARTRKGSLAAALHHSPVWGAA